MKPIFQLFQIFLRLGLTSFGGPLAHLGFFHNEFVKRRKWLSEQAYADLVSLCQILPGPASSQVGMAIGYYRGGHLGAIAAWLGFTLPSAFLMVLLAFGVSNFLDESWLRGLKIAAVAVVAQAIVTMASKFCRGIAQASIALLAALATSIPSSPYFQILAIILGGALGLIFLKTKEDLSPLGLSMAHRKKSGFIYLSLFFLLLVSLPLLAKVTDLQGLKYFDSFYRAGALVFGGGHIVLPLLESEIVSNNWVTNEIFMAGYGAAQAIPGPLFAFAAYLGAVMRTEPSQICGAIISLLGIFLPSFLLILGVLPFWEKIRLNTRARNALRGINAAVVGILLQAFYNPVWTSSIFTVFDFLLALACFLLLTIGKAPSWAVVILSAVVAIFFRTSF